MQEQCYNCGSKERTHSVIDAINLEDTSRHFQKAVEICEECGLVLKYYD